MRGWPLNPRQAAPVSVHFCPVPRPVCLLLACACVAALLGCAAPGEPTVRRPLIPQAVTDLAVRQQDDSVVLSFTLPQKSIDAKTLPEPPTVEIYRDLRAPAPTPANPVGGPAPRKLPGRLVDTIPGLMVAQYAKENRVEFPDPLDPSDLARQPGQQLFYTVRTRASRTRDSADSNTVALRVYPAPEPVGDLHVTVTEQAIVLAWTPPSQTVGGAPLAGPLTYRVYRADVAPENAAAALANPSQSKLAAPPVLLGEVSKAEYSDASVEWGHVYFYTVRASYRFASDLVEAADPTPAVVLAKDVFPPATPKGLEAVIVPATTEAPPYVEVAWGISPEADLAGYVVYRSEQSDTQGTRQNTELLLAPTFRDISVVPGRRYFYRVAAVDRSGNESPASPAVVAEVPGR